MMALQSALLLEESTKAKFNPAMVTNKGLPTPQALVPAALEESLEARLNALTQAIDGDDAALTAAAAEEAAKLEAKGRRMKEREAKREAKRKELADKEAAAAIAAGRSVAPVVVRARACVVPVYRACRPGAPCGRQAAQPHIGAGYCTFTPQVGLTHH